MDPKEHPFFAKVSKEQFEVLFASSKLMSCDPEEVIFEEGDPPDAFYLVLAGKIAFRKKLPSGHFLTISMSEENGFFGEVGVLTGDPRALRAESLGNSTILRVGSDALVQYISEMPGPIEQLLDSIIRHLHQTTRHYVEDMLHQEKMAVVGSMMNTILHDFKNPFCLISLSAQILRQQHTEPATIKACHNIELQVDRMVEMANELSEFSRGKQTLRITPINLAALLDEFSRLNAPFFDTDNIQIKMDIPSIEILGEKSKLFRVFQNLLANAIEAIGQKKGLIQIKAKDLPNESMVEITLSDNGNGIPESIQPRFFEPFVTYGKSEGTGLGTAIVKSLIDAHEGSIHFETEEEKGTTFYIRLPKPT